VTAPVRPPSVDALARSLVGSGLPHALCVDVARAAIARGAADDAALDARGLAAALLGPVVNATGVLLHTNLGRAPLAARADDPVARYANLELDPVSGQRGSRQGRGRPADLVCRLTGAEAALVVNNGAAAILLTLAATAAGRRVAVSRGQLVEIGGGFRVPEVVAQSGCELVEVGTTNRTRLADFEGAAADVALVVHASNYRIVGFTEQPSLPDLVGLGVPVVVDAGSGLLDADCPWLPGPPPSWLAGEPAVRQTLAAGAALVTCSGDKLLGGPQAGIIAGRADLVAACARHPLARALRPGGLVLAELSAVLLSYLARTACDDLPFWRMATVPVSTLRARAAALGIGDVVDTVAVPGGGSVPGTEIPSAGIAVDGDHSAALRTATPPVIARVDAGRTICDLRTVDPLDDPHLATTLRAATR
jgi:L-seryl-tRNA(Ser) seleniumtransferase